MSILNSRKRIEPRRDNISNAANSAWNDRQPSSFMILATFYSTSYTSCCKLTSLLVQAGDATTWSNTSLGFRHLKHLLMAVHNRRHVNHLLPTRVLLLTLSEGFFLWICEPFLWHVPKTVLLFAWLGREKYLIEYLRLADHNHHIFSINSLFLKKEGYR